MDDTLQINTSTITPSDSCVVSCNCVTGTSSTLVVDAPSPHNIEPYIIVGGVTVTVIILFVGCLLRRRIVRLESEAVNLRNQMDGCNQRLTLLKDEIKTLVAKVDDLPSNFMIVADNHIETSVDNDEERSEKGNEHHVLAVRYGTLQAPDENGVLRFSERTMVESSSPEKMFVLELDLDKGVGTYGINPGAMPLIFNDLQMFAEYVKPFSFNGNVRETIIENSKLGRIIRQDSFWVVIDPLEINIHN